MKALAAVATIAMLLTAFAAEAAPFVDEQINANSPLLVQEDALTEVASGEVIEPHFAVWSADGRGMYVASLMGVYFLPVDGGPVVELATLSPTEQMLSLSSRGDIAMLQAQETVVVRNAESGEEAAVVALEVPVSSASFSADGTRLAVVADEGARLLVWDVDANVLAQEFAAPEGLAEAYSVSWSHDGGSLAWLSPAAAARVDLTDGSIGEVVQVADGLADSALTNDGRFYVADETSLTAWDLASGEEIASYAAAAPVLALSLAEDDGAVAIATPDTVALLSASLDATVVSLDLKSYDVLFSAAGDRVGVIGADGTISIWE